MPLPDDLRLQLFAFVSSNPNVKQQLAMHAEKLVHHFAEHSNLNYEPYIAFINKYDGQALDRALQTFITKQEIKPSAEQHSELFKSIAQQIATAILLITVETPSFIAEELSVEPAAVIKKTESRRKHRDLPGAALKEILAVLPFLVASLSRFEVSNKLQHSHDSLLAARTKLMQGDPHDLDNRLDETLLELKNVETQIALNEQSHFDRFIQRNSRFQRPLATFSAAFKKLFLEPFLMDLFVDGIMGKIIDSKRTTGLINGDSKLILNFLHRQRSICKFLIENLPSLARMNQEYIKFSKGGYDSSNISVILKDEMQAFLKLAIKIQATFTLTIEERYRRSLFQRMSAVFTLPSWVEPTNLTLAETVTQLKNIFAPSHPTSMYFKSDAETLLTFTKKTLSRCNEELTKMFNTPNSSAMEKALQAQLLDSLSELYQESCALHERATMLAFLYPVKAAVVKTPAAAPAYLAKSASSSSMPR